MKYSTNRFQMLAQCEVQSKRIYFKLINEEMTNKISHCFRVSILLSDFFLISYGIQ